MKTAIAVGIDINPHDNLARLVFGHPRYNGATGWRSFRHVDSFARFWQTQLEVYPVKPSAIEVAVPKFGQDPFGIVQWLKAKGVGVYPTALTGESHGAALEDWGYPGPLAAPMTCLIPYVAG